MKTAIEKCKNTVENAHQAFLSVIKSNTAKNTAPKLPDPTCQSPSDTELHVPQSTVIRGDLSHPGAVVIAGTVLGNVSCRHLTINKNARIQGDVTAQELIIDGELSGTVSAPRIMFRPTSRVEGPVYCNWFKLEQGAYFEGRMRRMDPRRSLDLSCVDVQKADITPAPPSSNSFLPVPLALAG